MAHATVFLVLFITHLLFFKLADCKCPKLFDCGAHGPLEFPFSNLTQPNCGLFVVDCTSSPPRIQLEAGGVWYEFLTKLSTTKITIREPLTTELLNKNDSMTGICEFAWKNLSIPSSPFLSILIISPNITLFACGNNLYNRDVIINHFKKFKYVTCNSSVVYYKPPMEVLSSEDRNIPYGCSASLWPIVPEENQDPDFNLTGEFSLEWNVSAACVHCHSIGGQCDADSKNEFRCKRDKSHVKLILATTIPGAFVVVCLAACFIVWTRRKRKPDSYLLSRNISPDPSSKTDIESKSFYYGVAIFSYDELEEATNNFDSSKELGDGGFGTVYHGKLRDGRQVAIKRLYEHNIKRVEQFMNEIKILTSLRHPNLVTLYGCTSRRSRELILVYEYIPNGTVADHLHGDSAQKAPLAWSIRMNIAVETASALAYLHKSDIIHRDVKTHNILLDENFCVKVADFGLSRLFPNDVTHVSTAPQGTAGYVDPEYHQCYQLTDKSDVYSFGVVLIELISSMLPVDITRHRHEINLANLAISRIQQGAFDELIDQSLGYKSDAEVRRMTTSVAELAFRCLQLVADMRPDMDEVLDTLKDIRGDEDSKVGKKNVHASPESEDGVLLKKKTFQSSPNSVTDVWISTSTTDSSVG